MAAIDDLPPLRELIRRHRLSAHKALGQNFLLDLNLTARIARAAGPLSQTTVLEVGPGPGGLTRALLAAGAKRVVAVERDPRAVAALGELLPRFADRLMIIQGDALAFDVAPYVGGGKLRVVANTPYNIATALLVKWLAVEPWPPYWDLLVLMFQREVAERIVAAPGSKAYGRLAVLAQWRSRPQLLFDVAPSAFVPPPKVTSSLVRLRPLPAPAHCSVAALAEVSQAAFSQRRKMLRQSLRQLITDPGELIAGAGLKATARAEDVPVAGFVALARGLTELRLAGKITSA